LGGLSAACLLLGAGMLFTIRHSALVPQPRPPSEADAPATRRLARVVAVA